MKKALTQTITISVTQAKPNVRCGSVPLGAVNCTSPMPNAAIAAKVCNWIAGEAFSSGSSVIEFH